MKLPVVYHDTHYTERRKIREEYARLQKGLCLFCNSPLDSNPPKEITDKEINWKLFPPNFLRYPNHLQHCHKTGLTEGTVHAYCNAVMWQYLNR